MGIIDKSICYACNNKNLIDYSSWVGSKMKKRILKKILGALYFIVLPLLAYAIWYLINYFVTIVSSYISLLSVDESQLSADNL